MKRMMIEIGIKGFIVRLDIENHDEVLIVLRSSFQRDDNGGDGNKAAAARFLIDASEFPQTIKSGDKLTLHRLQLSSEISYLHFRDVNNLHSPRPDLHSTKWSLSYL